VDDETMESALAVVLSAQSLSLGLAESLTGGLIAARLVNVPGASTWFKGSVVSYDSEVKFSLLGVRHGPVVTREAAEQMATGARRVLGADVALAVTGVAGPDDQDGQRPGTVFVGIDIGQGVPESFELHLPGDRQRVRQYAAISALDVLRRRLNA
ncbi:MAG TPA: nicotinamide-nucleotide amidohydrolase family protein, partial [Acidimicrobiales bacterium]|nr:nicotinamide-nucleotide amidohydrolase family protein [Acidimicrobiales bacterium]